MLRFLIRQSPINFVLVIITGVVSGFSSAFLIGIINESLSVQTSIELFSRFFLISLFVLICSSYLARTVLLLISKKAVNKLRIGLCKAILECPLQKLEEIGKSKITAALTEDVLLISDTLALFPVLLIDAAVILSCLSYLVWLSPILSVLFILAFSVGIMIHVLITSFTERHLQEGRNKWDTLMGCYQDLIDGNKELKLNQRQRELFFNQHLQKTALQMQDISFSWHHIFAMSSIFGQVFYFLLIGAIVFLAPKFGFDNKVLLSGFSFIAIYLSGPISSVIDFMPHFKRAGISLEKINNLGFNLNEIHKKRNISAEVIPKNTQIRGILVRDLEFSYADNHSGKNCFKLFLPNIYFPSGQITFIVGHNGSGKSSLAKIISGLYEPTKGVLKLSTFAQPIDSLQLENYRNYFSVVFSDFHLFRNLHAFSDIERERALTYLKPLGLHNKIDILDHSFSTTDLSQGQKKRLALLIALAQDRPIYVFDEWSSDQDPEFKDYYYKKILPSLKAAGKLVIVISHDQQYFAVADRVIRLNNGRIEEELKLDMQCI